MNELQLNQLYTDLIILSLIISIKVWTMSTLQIHTPKLAFHLIIHIEAWIVEMVMIRGCSKIEILFPDIQNHYKGKIVMT